MRGTGFSGRSEMLTRTVLAGMLFAVGASNADAQSPNVDALDGEVLRGIDRLLLEDYEGAQTLFQGISEHYPDHPAGYLLQAGVLQTASMDYEELVDRPVFDSLLALAEEMAERMIENHPAEASGYFYLGSVYGYRSFADAAEGDWFGAATRAMSSVSEFEEALERDSTLADAKLGIGTYSYWKSRQMAFLTWLPFVGDQRAEGIRLIEETIADGRFNRHAAMTALIAILLDAEEYEKVVTVSTKALDDYPENRLFLWGLATGHERSGQQDAAMVAYRRLLNAILADPRDNSYNELVCRVNLARLELGAGHREDARSLLVPVLGRSPEDYDHHLHERAENKLKEARDLAAALARP